MYPRYGLQLSRDHRYDLFCRQVPEKLYGYRVSNTGLCGCSSVLDFGDYLLSCAEAGELIDTHLIGLDKTSKYRLWFLHLKIFKAEGVTPLDQYFSLLVLRNLVHHSGSRPYTDTRRLHRLLHRHFDASCFGTDYSPLPHSKLTTENSFLNLHKAFSAKHSCQRRRLSECGRWL